MNHIYLYGFAFDFLSEFKLFKGTTKFEHAIDGENRVLFTKINKVVTEITSTIKNSAEFLIPQKVGPKAKAVLNATREFSNGADANTCIASNLSPIAFAYGEAEQIKDLEKQSEMVSGKSRFENIISAYDPELKKYIANNLKNYDREYEKSLRKSLDGTITGSVSGKTSVVFFPTNTISIMEATRGQNSFEGKETKIIKLIDIFANIPATLLFESWMLVRRRNLKESINGVGQAQIHLDNGRYSLKYFGIPTSIYITSCISSAIYSQFELAMRVLEDSNVSDIVLNQFPDELLVRALDFLEGPALLECFHKFVNVMVNLSGKYADSYNLANFDNLVSWFFVKNHIKTSLLSVEATMKLFYKATNSWPISRTASTSLMGGNTKKVISFYKSSMSKIKEERLFD